MQEKHCRADQVAEPDYGHLATRKHPPVVHLAKVGVRRGLGEAVAGHYGAHQDVRAGQAVGKEGHERGSRANARALYKV